MSSQGITIMKRGKYKDRPLWLSLDEFYKTYKTKIMCAYAPIRGQDIKNKFCGITMTSDELDKVNGDHLELRCTLCTRGGNRKIGCGRKLINNHLHAHRTVIHRNVMTQLRGAFDNDVPGEVILI